MFIAPADTFCLLYANVGLQRPAVYNHYVLCSEQLGEELGCVVLPLLVVLAVAVPLVVLGLRHGDAAHFGDEESRERWAHVGQCQGTEDATRTSAEPNGGLSSLAGEDTRRGGRNTGPEGRLAEVVGVLAIQSMSAHQLRVRELLSTSNVPALPEASGHEVLGMLLLALLLQPLRLLLVGGSLERDASNPQRNPEHIGEPQTGEGRKRGRGDGVERDDGQADEGTPCRLGHPGDEELGRGLLDLIEAGVVAVAEHALEEVYPHCVCWSVKTSSPAGWMSA